MTQYDVSTMHTLPKWNPVEMRTDTKYNQMQQWMLFVLGLTIGVVVTLLISGTMTSAKYNKVNCQIQQNATPI